MKFKVRGPLKQSIILKTYKGPLNVVVSVQVNAILVLSEAVVTILNPNARCRIHVDDHR
jgi:hypothetical protein